MFLLVSVILLTGEACLRHTPRSRPPNPPSPEQTPPPGADTPPSRPPSLREQTPPPSRQPEQTPREQTPPPPREQTPAYDLRAAGTHPTGMHSCHFITFVYVTVSTYCAYTANNLNLNFFEKYTYQILHCFRYGSLLAGVTIFLHMRKK